MNPIEGIKNNVLGAKTICDVSLMLNIDKVILISTDKAVRPTNIMGASKRLSEIIFHYFSDQVNIINTSNKVINTKFTMVRFGNVLGSSGSVVPLFEKQINSGGPITITHPEIIRYFMSITEAAELVLQANAMAKGGELFLLDMGDPVKIVTLAKQMLRLRGLKLRDSKNNSGDIDIIFTGLRPGEKLYEELLIDGKSESTIHPLIYKAIENVESNESLIDDLSELEKALYDQERNKSLDILSSLVPEWVRTNSN